MHVRVSCVVDVAQVGVVSNGEGCGLPEFPGQYTSVAKVHTWLSTVVGMWVDASVHSRCARQDHAQ
jgi:secreted trypsin-like serine protease